MRLQECKMTCSWSEYMNDPLNQFQKLEQCPTCSALSSSQVFRCPECGTFHSTAHLEEREAPIKSEVIEKKPVDPSVYSINPNSGIELEEFEGDDSVVAEWKGGSTNFSFEEEDAEESDEED